MYHGLTEDGQCVTVGPGEARYLIPGSEFRDHLAMVAGEGFRAALLSELWTAPRSTPATRPAAVITFDDGRTSDYAVAYPTLAAAGARAEFFVNTATIGQPGYLDWSQVMEMHRAGLSFQSHSRDHVVLLGLSVTALQRQLGDSKRLLEDRLGAPVDFLAAPYGLMNRRVVQTALQIGYRAVCNSWDWTARPGAPTVNRVTMYRITSRRDFLRLLLGNPLPYTRRLTRNALVYAPKRLRLWVGYRRPGVQVLETGA
jgi:peptidoglycan/xylan/chitin deacetylase (PgdA/CDA1 family)